MSTAAEHLDLDHYRAPRDRTNAAGRHALHPSFDAGRGARASITFPLEDYRFETASVTAKPTADVPA